MRSVDDGILDWIQGKPSPKLHETGPNENEAINFVFDNTIFFGSLQQLKKYGVMEIHHTLNFN